MIETARFRCMALAVASTLAYGGAALLAAQTPTMPSTLRYGSGLIDVPVSSVLPHLTVTGTLSGYWVSLARRVEIDAAGAVSGYGPGIDELFTDGSLAVGLYDRAEVGTSLQAFGDEASGGSMWGLFGRVRLWEPVDQGVGVAVGARWLKSPSFGDGRDYAPGRLGFADERLLKDYSSVRGAKTNLSMYAVATAYLRGFDGGPIPPNDLTFSLGYGGGMFASGGALDFYAPGAGNGWFAGSSLHLEVSPRSVLTLVAEHNGFDANIGVHYDWEGYRVGAQYLATNHTWPAGGQTSEYWKPKLGLLASVAICPGRSGLRCRPRRMARIEPDTIRIPAPPPDTVVVTVGAPVPPPAGDDETLCLSTGQAIDVRVSAAGDTLVAPGWQSLRALGTGVALAGAYAAGTFWYESGQAIDFEGRAFERSADTFPVDCTQVLRVGSHQGVPIFSVVNAERPLEVLFVPVRPGLWHRYPRRREEQGSSAQAMVRRSRGSPVVTLSELLAAPSPDCSR